jgi:membrane protein CcdC involved in cytochrome C biogenesis
MARFAPVVFIVVLLAFVLARRMRPQPVRPQRLLVMALIVVGVVILSALGTGSHLLRDVPALLLAPVALALGVLAGVLLVRTMRFWTDERSGELWMRGGWLFLAILLTTIALRTGVRIAASQGNRPPAVAPTGFLADLSTDLLLISVGMWLTRAGLIYRRWQQHAAAV